jgi:hypothetical protein
MVVYNEKLLILAMMLWTCGDCHDYNLLTETLPVLVGNLMLVSMSPHWHVNEGCLQPPVFDRKLGSYLVGGNKNDKYK